MSASYRVVIVNFQKSDLVLHLLKQLSSQTLAPSSVSVIDNSPIGMAVSDEVAGRSWGFELEVHKCPDNPGYAKACNMGASSEGWDFVAFLNPDISVGDSDLFRRLLARVSELPNVGCAGVAQMNPDGTFETVARRFPSVPAIIGKRVSVFGRALRSHVVRYMNAYACDHLLEAEPLVVDWLQSSFLVVPRDAWERCGPFNESFYVFMADTEYGQRCMRKGLKSYLLREFKVEADGVRSSAGGLLSALKKRTVRIHIADAVRYFLVRVVHRSDSRRRTCR